LSAQDACEKLAPGESYEIDQTLLVMQMLKITKTNALDLHQRLREAVEPPQVTAKEPQTMADALPSEYLSMFASVPISPGLYGLYLSNYLDWHRLLALEPNGRYRLLFWSIHYLNFERSEIRHYEGK